MLEELFADVKDQVEIIREPLEGRPAYADYLIRKFDAKIFGIFGDDTYDKNLKIFWGANRFEFVRVNRPMVTMAESVWVPITHEREVGPGADGVSSSVARSLIAARKDASHVLSRGVISIIKDHGFYLPVSEESIPAQTADFQKRFEAFKDALAFRTGIDLSHLGVPKFKAGQTQQAQNDKFIRFIVESLELKAAEQFRLRPLAEEILGYSSRSRAYGRQGKCNMA